jgi:inner membrane protein
LSPVTHFLTGWVVANCAPSLGTRERAVVTLAGVVPDVDGLGAIPDFLTRNSSHPLNWFGTYHHQLHNLPFGVFVAGVSLVIAKKNKWMTALLVFVSFHLHLFEDILGGRGPEGYQWPIPYLTPFSHAAQLTWRGQWALNGWQNFAITFLLLLLTFYLAWAKGYSPLEMVSTRADKAFVATLRHRFLK